jgi:hypothetical protein
MKKIALTALLLAMLAACRKDPQKIILHGRFTEYGTGKPIQGARLYLGCEGGVPFGGSTYDLADSIVSDADGRFRKEYTLGEICGNLSLTPWKQGYFKGELRFYTTDNPFMDIVLDPMAWLKVVTVPDMGMWGSLGFGGSFRPNAVSANNGVEEQVFLGRGGRQVVLHWGPFSDPTIIYSDSIYLAPHDTTTYTIHY